VPSDDEPQGVEMAAGFAPSMEDTAPEARRVPERIENRDLDLEQKIDDELRLNSETRHLRNVRVYVSDGVASLFGTVPDDDDAARAVDLIADMPEVTMVYNYLEVEV
jgi:osmotically-inducible protein OsmY